MFHRNSPPSVSSAAVRPGRGSCTLVMIPVSTATSFLLARVGYRMPMLAGIVGVTITLTLLGL